MLDIFDRWALKIRSSSALISADLPRYVSNFLMISCNSETMGYICMGEPTRCSPLTRNTVFAISLMIRMRKSLSRTRTPSSIWFMMVSNFVRSTTISEKIRAFSIAITAYSAMVVSSPISRCENTILLVRLSTPKTPIICSFSFRGIYTRLCTR